MIGSDMIGTDVASTTYSGLAGLTEAEKDVSCCQVRANPAGNLILLVT